MKFLLVIDWDGYTSETKTFEAKSHEDALLKAFGDPLRLPKEAFNDPSWWFEKNTECNMYFHGDPPSKVSLFEVKEVDGANARLRAAHAAIEKDRSDFEKAKREAEEKAVYEKLKKKYGKES